MTDKELRFPARFDDEWWEADLARSSVTGQQAAEAARKEYEARGVARQDLRPCEAEAQDGTELERCFKVYLPPPAGRFGMVFLRLDDDRGRSQRQGALDLERIVEPDTARS